MGEFHENVEETLGEVLKEISISRSRINDQMLAVENSIMGEIGKRNVDIHHWIDKSASRGANRRRGYKSQSYIESTGDRSNLDLEDMKNDSEEEFTGTEVETSSSNKKLL